MDRKKLTKRFLLISMLLMVVLLLVPVTPSQAADTDGDGMDNITEELLAQQYAPILYFKAGENFFPVNVSYFVENSVLYDRTDSTITKIEDNPTISSIGVCTGASNESCFLNNSLGGYSEILTDYSAKKTSLGYTVYARVTTTTSCIVVQYWFFYVYNDFTINQHEGDWEMIEVILDSASTPIGAAYSQHYSGQYAAWADVEKEGTDHPKVYVAKGSHANYFRSYQGKMILESDEVGSDGLILKDTDYNLVFLGERGNASEVWLDYSGRWGNWQHEADATLGFAGPHGPGVAENKDKWDTTGSCAWGVTIFSVDDTWFTLSWIMYYLLYIFLAIIGVLALIKVIKLIRARTSSEQPSLSDVYQGRAIVGTLLVIVAVGLLVAAIFVPWYTAYLNIPSISAEGDVLIIDGIRGVQVNFLVTGSGMTPLFSLGIPFYLFVAAGAVFTVLDILGAKSAKKLGTKNIFSGAIFIVFLIIILILASQLANIISTIETSLGITLPPGTSGVVNAISANPFQGSHADFILGVGNITVIWGFAIGGFLLLGASIVKIVAGIILRTTPESA